MRKAFLFKLSFRNLMAHKLRTILTLLGILIGVSAITFLVSFAFGLENLVTEQVTQGDAFKLVDVGAGNSKIVKINQATLDKISGIGNIKSVEAIINAAGKGKKGDKSIDTSVFGSSSQYMDWAGVKIRWGKPLNLSDSKNPPRDAVVSQKYLSILGGGDPSQYLGQKITLDIMLSQELMADSKNKVLADQQYTIVGITQDNTNASVYTLTRNLTAAGVVNFSQAKVELVDRSQIPQTRQQIENLGFKTQYVGDTVNQIDQVFSIFKVILGSFGLIALIVAALGMFNTLTISLLERTKEIALMKILGMRKRDIQNLFISEAAMLSTFGGLVGILTGYLLALLANNILNSFAIRAGGSPVNIFYLPLWFVLAVVAFSFAIGLLTGIYPARRATRINALDVMRYE